MARDDRTYLVEDKKTKERISLEVKWTISRGRDSYDYNICSLWQRGQKVASCNGGGYDMIGTVFAQWLCNNYMDRLEKLPKFITIRGYKTELYGLSHYDSKRHKYLKRKGKNTRTYVDGACGISSVERIAKAAGISITNMTYL